MLRSRHLVPAVLGLVLVGCETAPKTPDAPRPEPASVADPGPPAAVESRPEVVPHVPAEPTPRAEPAAPPEPPPGLAARVEPLRPAAPSPYPPRLEQLLASPPSEPLVPATEAGDPVAWAKAGRRLLGKERHADAIHAFAQAAKLEPTAWRHPFEIARAAVQSGDVELAKVALAQSYLLDIGQASDAVWEQRDFAPIWREHWFLQLGIGELSVVLGNATDWTPHGLRLHGVTVRFIAGDPIHLQIHARADVEAGREKDWVVWATSCEEGGRVHTELRTMNRHFGLDFDPTDAWGRPAAIGYAPSLALKTEPRSCEFRFYRLADPRGEPLPSPPVWMADFCWTRGKPGDAGMAREGRCGLVRPAGPRAAFAVESLDVKAVQRHGAWELDQTVDIVIGEGAGQWKTVAVDTTCRCASEGCEEETARRDGLRDEHLWFVEAGEHVRLRDVARFAPGWTPGECTIEIGTRGPHPWGELQQWTRELDVVARYCYRDGTATAGACS